MPLDKPGPINSVTQAVSLFANAKRPGQCINLFIDVFIAQLRPLSRNSPVVLFGVV